jgi:hypothetical protein
MYRLSYGDGVPSRSAEEEKTFIHEIIPGVTLSIGDRWSVDYSPVIRFYSSDRFQDGVNHTVGLRGGATYQDWIFGFSHTYASTSDPLVETGRQTGQENHSTALSGVYRINSEVSLEIGLSQSLRFTEEYNDSLEWSTMDWLNYQVAPPVGLAFGVGGGYVNISDSSDMTFEQVQGRVTFRPGDKFSLLFSGGLDIRQFLDSDVSGPVNPIFAVTAAYQVFEPTSVSLTGSRSVSSSYHNGEITENTSISANVNQRLLKKLYLSLGGGYRTTAYVASEQDGNSNNDRDGFFFNSRLSTGFLERGTVGIFYTYSQYSSNEAIPGYSSSQIGLEIGYRF